MSRSRDDSGGGSDRTMMIDVKKIKPPPPRRSLIEEAPLEPTDPIGPREWQPYQFSKLEKVSKSQVNLLRGLEWMLPNVRTPGDVNESVRAELQEMIKEEVRLEAESMHVVNATQARRFLSDPTFLAVLAPVPNKTRGLLEVELRLAHVLVDMVLGGAGETVALRPLTDLEEGVITYVLIKTLKVLAPSLDPSLPTLRIESVCRSFEEAVTLLGEDEHLAVVQLRLTIGEHSGYVRLFVPESVLSMARPPTEAAVRRARRSADAAQNASRLSQVRVWLRAEIGQVEISAADLGQVREGDVILVDGLKTRPDQGESGTASLKLGPGLTGSLNAETTLENGRYSAKITEIQLGESGVVREGVEGEGAPPPADTEEAPAEQQLGEEPDESTSPGKKASNDVENSEGSDLLNDIPLQIAVELGRVPMTAEEVVGLKVGHVIDLNRSAGEPLDLSVNGKVVARGELVEVDGNLGIRILSLAG